MICKKLIFSKNIIILLLLSILVLGCNSQVKTPQDNTKSNTKEEVTDTKENKTSKELVVGYWKMIFDPETDPINKTQELSEEDIEKMKAQFEEYPTLFQFTEDGKLILSGDENAEEYKFKGDDKIKISDDVVTFTVTENELSLELEGDMIKFVRSDKATWDKVNEK